MDEMEFERRARACTEKLFRVCYALLPERADRADAIQEALFKAWRKRGMLRDSAVFEAWLLRIAINECKNIIRHKQRKPTAELSETIPANNSIPDLALHNALQTLDVKLRVPIVLHYIEGYTTQETARLLGIPLGTTKNRLKQARSILREQLKEE